MKNISYLLSVVVLMIISTNMIAQDKIFLKTGDKIEAKILEINVDDVKYKKYSNLDGPAFTIVKSDIHMIIYENGESEIFKKDLNNEILNLKISGEDMFLKGQRDASSFYKGYKGAGTGTLITSLLSPLLGLIPAISTSATNPNYSNLGFPNEKLMKNSEYYNGYTKKAKKIKQGRVWLNWGIGLGANIIASAIILSSE